MFPPYSDGHVQEILADLEDAFSRGSCGLFNLVVFIQGGGGFVLKRIPPNSFLAYLSGIDGILRTPAASEPPDRRSEDPPAESVLFSDRYRGRLRFGLYVIEIARRALRPRTPKS